MKSSGSKSSKSIPKKSADVLVTKAMLFEVRGELIEKIQATKSELKSDISKVHSDIQKIQSDVHKVQAEVHRVAVLVEEQNARNKPVLDSILSIMERQERVENDQVEMRKILVGGKF